MVLAQSSPHIPARTSKYIICRTFLVTALDLMGTLSIKLSYSYHFFCLTYKSIGHFSPSCCNACDSNRRFSLFDRFSGLFPRLPFWFPVEGHCFWAEPCWSNEIRAFSSTMPAVLDTHLCASCSATVQLHFSQICCKCSSGAIYFITQALCVVWCLSNKLG